MAGGSGAWVDWGDPSLSRMTALHIAVFNGCDALITCVRHVSSHVPSSAIRLPSSRPPFLPPFLPSLSSLRSQTPKL
eukprot:144094-Rhodomonas_salina.1